MSLRSELIKLQNKLKGKLVYRPFAQNESGSVESMKSGILAIVSLVVIVTLGVAILPGSITSLSNTSAIPGYTTWSPGAQSVWTALAIFVVLVFLIILVGLLIAALA